MIVLKNSALDESIFSDNEKAAIKYFVNAAADHGGASTGQILAYKFLKSLDGDGEVNLNDVRYHFEPQYICGCIMARSKGYLISDYWEIID